MLTSLCKQHCPHRICQVLALYSHASESSSLHDGTIQHCTTSPLLISTNLQPRDHAAGACMQSILYHATSGIWRTVWLEPVPDQHIKRVDMIPDVDKKLLSVTVHGNSDAVGLDVGFRVADAGKEVALVPGRVGKTFTVSCRL